MTEPTFRLHRGRTALLLSLPHCGEALPEWLAPRLVPRAAQVEDTDWHLARLYDFAQELGASVITPVYSRYLVDLNRPADNQPMYPGANNTELCPTRFFSGESLYLPGQEPDEAEVQQRVQRYWQPYHDALRVELARLKHEHGHAALFDGHSIKSKLPWLFEGRLPDLNLGTANAAACAPSLRAALTDVLSGQHAYTHVVDGRFKGGHITRHHGRPHDGVHAVQLEMCWRCYMREEPPYTWDEARAAQVQPLLRQLLQALLAWKPE